MGAQDQDVVFGERRAAYPHHGLTVEPQPFTMGAEDALDAYDVAQKEAKDTAVTKKKGKARHRLELQAVLTVHRLELQTVFTNHRLELQRQNCRATKHKLLLFV